jgi:Arc/MetJ family transcription regulator
MHHEVYGGVRSAAHMARTNVEVDDRLVAEVIRRYHLRTKKEAIDLALRRLVGEAAGSAGALALEGSGWEGDLDTLRRARLPG